MNPLSRFVYTQEHRILYDRTRCASWHAPRKSHRRTLKYHLPGAWSRRVDDEHRLVYIVTEAEIIVLAARYHY